MWGCFPKIELAPAYVGTSRDRGASAEFAIECAEIELRRPDSEFDALDDFRQLTCTNRKGIRRAVLEGLILDALKHNLMHPDFVAEFIREFHAELNRQRRDAELTINFKRRELEETCRKLDGLIEAIADGFRARDFRQSSTSWSGRKPGFSPKLRVRPSRQHGCIPI